MKKKNSGGKEAQIKQARGQHMHNTSSVGLLIVCSSVLSKQAKQKQIQYGRPVADCNGKTGRINKF